MLGSAFGDVYGANKLSGDLWGAVKSRNSQSLTGN